MTRNSRWQDDIAQPLYSQPEKIDSLNAEFGAYRGVFHLPDHGLNGLSDR